MIGYAEMKRLAAEAQDQFPLTPDHIMAMQITGSRDCLNQLVEERMLWMLNQAFGKNKNEPNP